MASSAFVHIKWFAEEYSVQTARGAGRRDKPYEYFRFLLDEITEHLYGREHDPNDRAFLNDLLPWSDKLPDICKKENLKFAGAGFGSSFVFAWRLWLSGYV